MNDDRLEIRPAPCWLFVLVLAAVASMMLLVQLVPTWLWRPLYDRSYGFVNLWFIAYTLLVVCGVLLGVGRRRRAELGLEWRKVPTAALYTGVLWIGLQIVLAGWYSAFESVQLARGWTDINVLWKAGELTNQLLGNALNEEIVYRGFFLMQLFLLLRARWPQQPCKAFVGALLLVSAGFAVSHVPTRLMRGDYTSISTVVIDQSRYVLIGCVFGWIYWRTGNLFFTVGVHALANQPTTLWAWYDLGPVNRADYLVYVLGVVIAAAWHRLPATERPVVRPRRLALAGLGAFLLIGSIGVVLWGGGLQPAVQVAPAVFADSDEFVRGEGFLVLADRRVFAAMAFLNAAGYDEEAAGHEMHPVRVRVRAMVQRNLAKHPRKLQAWRKYYKRNPFGSHQYQDFALSLSTDYPFKRIRPDDELGYRHTAKALRDFPDLLNDFWVTAGLGDVWNDVRPDYIAEIRRYNFDKMQRQLSFLYQYLRMERTDSYTIVNVPNLLEAHEIGVGVRYEDYYYSVESPGSHDYDLNIHEYLHSIVNPLVKAHYEKHRSKLGKYVAAGKSGPLTKTYQDPVIFTYECLVRALDQRVSIQLDGDPSATQQREARIARETRDGLTLVLPIYRLLAEFESSGKRFDEFVPLMLDQLPPYAP